MPLGPVSSPAFLLKAANYGESDQVLTLYLRQLGKVSCLARGARNSKKRFGSLLRPFCKFEVVLRVNAPQAHALPWMESAQELDSYPGLLSQLDSMASGWRLLELCDKLEEPGSAQPDIFDALDRAFGELCLAASACEAGLRCEAALLTQHGWAPRVDACVRCLKPWPFESARFSMGEGGLLCRTCKETGSWMTLERAEVLALRSLFHLGSDPVAPGRAAVTNFIQHQLGAALRTDQFERGLKGAF